jgi:hypothetical protein
MLLEVNMLNSLLRNFSVSMTMLIGVTACSFASTPVGQGSNNSSASKRRDAGASPDADLDATTPGKRRLSTRKADARVEDQEQDLDAGEVVSEPAQRDAGIDRNSAAGSSGSGTKPVENDRGQTPTKPADAGMKMSTPPRPADAGPKMGAAGATATDAGDPIGNLEELSKMSPSARTSATIDKFLTTLSEGDAPASSIKEFLTSINEEVNCKMNPFAYECLTACQAVGTTCALCILDAECRMTMLDICGVSALGGCIRR